MKPDENRLTTLEAHEQPSAQLLIDELKEALVAASGMGIFERLQRCHNTKQCEWPGRQTDGRLPEKNEHIPVFRWKGAPDVRVPMCDKIVRWLALIRMSVYNRGSINIGPQNLPNEAEADSGTVDLAGIWQNTMEYFAGVSDWGTAKAFNHFGTCVEELGYGLMLADWQTRQREELMQITTQQISDSLIEQRRAQMLEMIAAEAIALGVTPNPEPELSPEMDALAVSNALVDLEEMLSAKEITPAHLTTVQALDDRMTTAAAKRVIRDLRNPNNEGKADYHAPKDDGGIWEVTALTPWVNALHPYDLGGDGTADWIAVPRYLTEAQVRVRARRHKWKPDHLQSLLDTQKNQFWAELNWGVDCPWALNGVGIGMAPNMEAMDKSPRWLVVDMWRVMINDKGLTRIARAELNPHMADVLLSWRPTDLVKLPIVVDTAEPCTYAMQAKGVADVVEDKQNFVKDSLDSEGSRGRMGSNPPLMRTVNQSVQLQPGIQLYAKRSGQSFEGSEFMKIPGVDMGHLDTVDRVQRLVEQYYFRSEDTSQSDRRMFEEDMRFKSIRCYRELLRLLWEQVQEHIEELQVSRINGRAVNLDARRDQLQGEADIHIGVHLDGFSEDAAEKFVKVGTQLMQSDRGGNMNWAEFTTIATQLLSPTYSRRLVMTSQEAGGRIVEDQENRIAKMMAGVPITYVEKVSNPEMRLQVMDKWMQVPGNVQRAQADPVAGQMMQKEIEYLNFQLQQRTENATTGRTGVTPNEPETMGAAQ
jgi:hypothetical protein